MIEINEISKRLSKYLKDNNIGVNELGRMSQTSGAQVSNIINGKVYGVDKLLKILNIIPSEEANWILTGAKMITQNDYPSDYPTQKIGVLEVNEPQEIYTSKSLHKELKRLKDIENEYVINNNMVVEAAEDYIEAIDELKVKYQGSNDSNF